MCVHTVHAGDSDVLVGVVVQSSWVGCRWVACTRSIFAWFTYSSFFFSFIHFWRHIYSVMDDSNGLRSRLASFFRSIVSKWISGHFGSPFFFANFSAIIFVPIVCQNVFPDLLSCSPLLFSNVLLIIRTFRLRIFTHEWFLFICCWYYFCIIFSPHT